MLDFDFDPRTHLVFGPGKIRLLGELAAQLGVRRVLVVSDPGIVRAGHTQRGLESLRASGLEPLVFDAIAENPTSAHVDAGVVVARDFRPELIVGLGGGSSMDCAKGINFVYTGGGQMRDYWGVGKATKPMLPLIAVPTTAGTGSEMQSFALISDPETHVKMACGDKKASCRVALLDPELTLTQPEGVTALSGIDALSHALETYVTRRRTPLSVLFSREAWRLLANNFARVLDDPQDLEARGAMQLGAALAGLAIENSMLGAAHALANPLTATYGIAHGQAVALMLPHVVRFNGEQFGPWYAELLAASHDAAATGENAPAMTNGAAATAATAAAAPDQIAEQVTRWSEKAGLATRLSSLSVARERFEVLAADAAKQWTGTFNPRTVTEAELHALYERAY